jgi:NAD(P)-dependent dehydrogenase (short-subunit alcohol dehydrogenase family)
VDTYGDAVLPLQLDVTDRAADVAAITRAYDRFGRLDIVVNNAGYGLFGPVERLSEEQARTQMDTNFFGALWVTQAALPYLRDQHSGHIVQVSSIGGIVALPRLGLYHASKWALEGMSEALAQEVAPLDIHVTLIEPGDYRTDWGGSSLVRVEPGPEYEFLREARQTTWAPESALDALYDGPSGDPSATQQAILTLVDTPDPPLRLFLGSAPLAIARPMYEQRLHTWEQWAVVSQAAQGDA